MRGRILLGLALLLSLAMALAGCGGGGGGDETIWSGTGIHGYVTAGRGDNALAGVTVELYAVDSLEEGTYIPAGPLGTPQSSTITGSSGYYRFADLAPGDYLIQVESTNLAGARYQYLRVTQDQRVRADLILFPNLVRPEGAGAALPYITSLELVEGETGRLLQIDERLSGTVLLRVAAQSGASDLPIKRIMVKIGHLSNGSNETFDDKAVAAFDFDTTRLGNGTTSIYVTAYDMNDNAASVSIPVVIVNDTHGAPARPEIVRVQAWTFGMPHGYKSLRDRRFDLSPLKAPLKVKVGGKEVYLPNTSSLYSASRALGTSGSVMTHIQIKPHPSAASYRIYRRTGASGEYQLIGERTNSSQWYEPALADDGHWDALWFNDLDPALKVGQDYYYRVKAVNGSGESDFGYELRVIILPVFTASLVSPDGSQFVDIETAPIFNWTASGGFGTTNSMCFLLSVLGKNDEDQEKDVIPYSLLRWIYGADFPAGTRNFSFMYNNEYDQYIDEVIPKPLARGAVYEWDLYLAFSGYIYPGMGEMGIDGESYAMSLSYPHVDCGSSNGAFSFTTEP